MSDCCEKCRTLESENAELRHTISRLRSESHSNISLRSDLLEARLELRRLQLAFEAQKQSAYTG